MESLQPLSQHKVVNWSPGKTLMFVEDLHNTPELWDANSLAYKDRTKRQVAIKILAEKYKASPYAIKRKIKNLRSAFNREHKKLQRLRKDGQSSSRASWFAYESLTFLLEDPRLSVFPEKVDPEDTAAVNGESTSSIYIKSEIDIDDDDASSHETTEQFDTYESYDELPSESVDIKESARPSPVADKCRNDGPLTLTNSRDEFSVFGEYVANELRNLSSTSQVVAKYKINNTLFEAAIGRFETEYADVTRKHQSQRSLKDADN